MGRKPWRAVWSDALRSSPKWRRLQLAQKAFWLECFLMAQDDGRLELKPGSPLTATHLAYELQVKKRQVEGYQNALVRVGLAQWSDGYFCLTKMAEMCDVNKGRSGTTKGQPGDKRCPICRNLSRRCSCRSSADNGLGPHNPAHIKESKGGGGGLEPSSPSPENTFNGHRKGDVWQEGDTKCGIDDGGALWVQEPDSEPVRKGKVL